MPLYHKCSYKDCKSTPKPSSELSFHRFPSDEASQAKWIELVGVPKLAELKPRQLLEKRICSNHFATKDFINYDRNRGRRKLKCNAVPISIALMNEISTAPSVRISNEAGNPIFVASSNQMSDSPDCVDLTDPIINEICVKTTESTSSTTLNGKSNDVSKPPTTMPTLVKVIQPTFRELKLMKKNTALTLKLKKARQAIRNMGRKSVAQPSVQKVIESAANYIDGDRLLLFSMQLNHLKHTPWSDEEKRFALELFIKSSECYTFLRDVKRFNLPCETLVRRWKNEAVSKNSN